MQKDVLVIGGGVAGIQASLDLAERGIKVHLVEREPSIGGRMAQLDKTYPTMDCAMCILAPKMTDCFRHPNITVHTYSEVAKVDGKAGNFKVLIRKNARYVDEEKCTGCGICAENCPVSVPSEFNMGLGERPAIYRPFPQAVPPTHVIERKETPPCQNECPAGVAAQGYIALIAQRRFKEALDVIKRRNPLPAICGRICHHPCEQECSRNEVDEPVSIARLKRFIADYELKLKKEGKELTPKTPTPVSLLPTHEKKNKKVAIVGSGPAGLTASYYLAMDGYEVTIFEALPFAGGMLLAGIPRFLLPKDIIEAEIDSIKEMGVEIRTNTPIKNLDDLFQQGYEAIFIAVGAQKSRALPIPGANLKGVSLALPWLRDVNLGKDVKVSKKIGVIGGGGVAIDVARCAVRLGAEKVYVCCIESRDEMPSHPWDIQAAEEEGIELRCSVSAKQILGKEGKVCGLELLRVKWFKFDEEGKLKIELEEGSEHSIEVEEVIFAIGQAADLSFLENSGVNITSRGTIEINPDTLSTSRKGVFAGGDVVSGPASVVEAVHFGRRAALAIDAYLSGKTPKFEEEKVKAPHPIKDEIRKKKERGEIEPMKREPIPMQSPEKRIKNFDEVEFGYDEEAAVREAKRCLACGVCSRCEECVRVCEARAIDYNQTEKFLDVDVGAIIVATGFDLWDPSAAPEYGYGKYPNVYTSLEFERLINAAGPTGGHIVRRSDGKPPRKIAWIQCVGSRDTKHNPYCCSVCCMYATKEAMLVREHGDFESTIFYKDMRAFGKGFFEFTERAKTEYGVNYINSDATVEGETENHNPIVAYDVEGKRATQEFDMVILAPTLVPSRGAEELAKILEIGINEFKFFESTDSPVDTKMEGIYIAGYCQGPKDIPEAVAQGSAAAARVCEVISEVV